MERPLCSQCIYLSSTHRSFSWILFLTLTAVLAFGSYSLAQQPEPTGGNTLSLTADESDAAAHWTILSADSKTMRLEFRLSGLRLQEVQAGGKTWQALSIDRGGLAGVDGSAGLPITGRLIAIPQDVMITARIVDFETREIRDLNLMPVQAPKAENFQWNPATYEQKGWQKFRPAAPSNTVQVQETEKDRSPHAPAVFLGTPALMAGQAVLPLTVGPVAYDPVLQLASVATRVEIELRFDSYKTGSGLISPRSQRKSVGQAFASLLQDQVSGIPNKTGTGTGGLGTWAIVCSSTEIQSHLEPLLQWRARQGYQVEVIVSTGTNSDIKDLLQSLYNDASLPALEFIVLAGDPGGTYAVPTWYEDLSGYHGEGDHYYSTLEGDDILADVHVSRLSFTNLGMLDTIVNKILGYEQSPPMANTSWFHRACVMGDPEASGITTIYVNQWLKGQLLFNGYAQVDTVWGGDFVTQMMASVNGGVSALGYRGFYNMSGITTAHVRALNNGTRLPVAILPTCETGSFAGPTACLSEAWLQATNGGAVAAVGTATGGTHTRYNNCFYQGIWDGLLNTEDQRIGFAHTLGKLELFNNYYLAEPHSAEIWAVWNNIMGDCATEIWQSAPRILTVEHPAMVAEGAGTVEFRVESEGQPVADAMVCLYRTDELQVTGRTDSAGIVLLSCPALTAGSVLVTVTGNGLLPYQGGLQVGTSDLYCDLADFLVDDDSLGASSGNGDSLFNPGETIELSLAAANLGTSTAFGISGILTENSPWSTLESGSLDFGEIAPGKTVWASSPVEITIDAAAPDGAMISCPLRLTDGLETWSSIFELPVHAAALSVADVSWDAGSTFEPGQSGQLVVDLLNSGSLSAQAASTILSSDSPWLVISGGPSAYGDIGIGTVASNSLDPFQLEINSSCIAGHLAVLRLDVSYNNGLQTSTEFTITVGTANTDDPTGPDSYGYYAFDNTDNSSVFAPVYDWIALDPDHSGPGTAVGLTDFDWEQDDTRTVDLPFTFRYYGVDFDQVSICSNGWLAMGETPLVHYRNYSIPSKGSPGGMIAPFWDNLNQADARLVYSYYDAPAHRFIVQWYLMPNHFSGAVQNFEVILLDPAWHPTATGDGIIVFQYATVENTDSRDGYATVGIQNLDRTDGVLYSYWNQYASGASELQSGRAIRFQPIGDSQLPVPLVSPATISESMKPGESSLHTLYIGNSGPEGTLLSFQINKVDPATIPAKGSDKSIQGSTLTCASAEYEPGTTLDLEFTVHAVADFGFMSEVHLQFPVGVTLNSSSDFLWDDNPVFFWREQTGNGVITSWDGFADGFMHYLPNGASATATINLTFDGDLTQDLEIAYTLMDNVGFTDPDQVDGVIVLVNDNPSVRVSYPSAGTQAVIGSTLTVEFEILNASNQVDIYLKRQPEGPWETLATAVDASSGTWDWLVAGDPGSYAVIKVADHLAPELFDESDVFVVGRNLDWLQLAQTEGSVLPGQVSSIFLTLDGTSLPEDQYSALLLIETNSGHTIQIPVELLISVLSAAGELPPQTVGLLGNYPNPFNPSTTLSFTLPREMKASLDIYSTRGMLVRHLLDGRLDPGIHHVVWNGLDNHGHQVPSGVYFCRLKTPEKAVTEKLVLAK